jgi:uncharacterized membrane protein HdeD (DUF308 family)
MSQRIATLLFILLITAYVITIFFLPYEDYLIVRKILMVLVIISGVLKIINFFGFLRDLKDLWFR